MAHIIYALSGQGRGHTSRVIAISDALRRRGHEVTFCCGGTALDILTARGEPVLRVPALRQTVRDNRLRVVSSVRRNWLAAQTMPQTVARLAGSLASLRPDLLITDFEVFSPRAAQRIGLPVLSFNHQQMVTATRYPLSPRYRLQAALASSIIRLVAPRNPAHLLLTSFFFPPLKDPAGATLVPPILRPAVQTLVAELRDYVLVYWNHPAGNRALLDALRQVQASFIVYNAAPPAHPADYPNVQVKEPSEEGFLKDLARCRAVVCTAGFTLISEALYLGKPLLVAPNHGLFEQTLNALFLQREGLGEAVVGRPLAARDVAAFLARLDDRPARRPGRAVCGNPKAVACIEAVLARLGPSVHLRPALPYRAVLPFNRTPTPTRPQQEPV